MAWKKAPTEEQKAAAKARREKFKGFVRQLSAMSESERAAFAARCPIIATCEGHALSPLNSVLVAMQCPTATLVGGFRQWKKQGRSVKKGEHGLMIWVPLTYGNGNDDTPQPSDVDPNAEEGKTRMRFIIGTVFDVGQTTSLGNFDESEAA